MRLHAYVAGPLGFSESGRFFYYKKLLPMISHAGFEILDPWELTDSSLIASAMNTPEGVAQRERWMEVNSIIGHNNDKAIKKCSIVVAILDGSDVDSGTATEIGAAATLGKLIIGYRSDFRLSTDNVGSTVNLQVEYYIRKNGGDIVRDLDTLKEKLSIAYVQLFKNSI